MAEQLPLFDEADPAPSLELPAPIPIPEPLSEELAHVFIRVLARLVLPPELPR